MSTASKELFERPARTRGPRRNGRAPTLRVPRLAIVLLGAAVSSFFLWLALRGVELGEVRSALGSAEWAWLAPTLVLVYTTLAARAVRWRLLFDEPAAVSSWEAAKALNVGLMFNAFLPSRAGELPRLLALSRSSGVSKVETAGTIVVERVLDLLAVAVLGVLLWPWLPDQPWIGATCLVCAAVVAATVVVGAASVVMRRSATAFAARLLRSLPFLSRATADELVASLRRGVRVIRKPRRIAVALGLSVVVWAVAGLSIVARYPAFGLEPASLSPWLILVVTSLAMTVPSTAGGLGVYEAAVTASLVAFGVAAGAALSFALVLHAVNLLPLVATGILALWSGPLRLGAGTHPPS